jgi:competence protein ComEC
MLIISLLFFWLFRISVFEFASPISLYTHNLCLDRIPAVAAAGAELRALICAENFSTLAGSGLYISAGLIHLFVVSGAHLILLEKILKPVISTGALLVFLSVYALACGLNPPVTRSLIAFLLAAWLSQKNINWPQHLKILIVGLCTLLFHSEWILSVSLQLSWLAAFLVSAFSAFFSSGTPLFRQWLFFIGMFPTLVFFQVPGPTSILLNLFLAPVLELVLFPLALLVAVFNFLHPVFDLLIALLRKTLALLELKVQIQTAEMPPGLIVFNWALIFLLHGIAHVAFMRSKRPVL